MNQRLNAQISEPVPEPATETTKFVGRRLG